MIEHVESAHLRHHQIENDNVGAVLTLEYVERLLSVKCHRYSEWPLLELDLDDAADVRFIIGNENVFFVVALAARHSATLENGRNCLSMPPHVI